MRRFEPRLLLVGTTVHAGWGLVEDRGSIVAVGETEALQAEFPMAESAPLPDMLLVAGTVNAHSHSFQSLLRGLGDDQPFTAWRDVLYRHTPNLDVEGVYAGGLLAFGEMLLRGVTTVCDFFYLNHQGNARAQALAQAARDVGIRLVLARTMMDWTVAPPAFRESPEQAVANVRALAAELQGDPLVTVIPAPHSPHGASSAMVAAGAALAREMGTPWHIHVAEAPYEGERLRAEHGAGPIEWLRRAGGLDERIRIVHGVWLDSEEVRGLAGAGGGLIHCPGSNLFLGDGMAPIPRYLEAGVPVALGCDSGSANSRLSVFGEMRLAATLQKGMAGDSSVLTAEQAWTMGTSGGGFAAGLAVGDLAAGSRADLVALDVADLSLQPYYPRHLLRTLVYAMEATAIRHVYVGGRQVVRDGRLVGVSEDQIAARVRAVTAGWGDDDSLSPSSEAPPRSR